jgi:hypothetical protein
MPTDRRAGSVSDLFTENACPGTSAMDVTCNDRDRIPGQDGVCLAGGVPGGRQVSRTPALHASVR